MSSVHDRHFQSAGVPIRFVDEGEGTPVILIHGYTGTAETWKATRDMLSRQFRVIAVDCRGHGRSGKPHDAASYGTEMVTDLVELLGWLKIEEAHIVGYSMGAEIALKLATQHPTQILSLTIGGSGWSGKADYENYRNVADSLEKSGSFGPLLVAMTPTGKPGPTDEEIALIDEILTNQDTDALAAVARGMNDIIDLSEDEISSIRFPVLGIAGEHDPERGNIEKMAGVVPDFKMKILAGRDHMSAMSDPQYNSSLLEFLSRQP